MKYRCLKLSSEFRAEESDGEKHIEGYFADFNGRYDLWGGNYETIDAHAFDGQLEGDVRALINHDTTLVLGRTTAGTLTLRVDERGLWGSIKINPEDSDALNLYARVKRGDVSQCSFGFDTLSEERVIEEKAVHWILKSVKLYEVSPCTFPAYKSTEVGARGADDESIDRRKAEIWTLNTKERISKWH